MATGPPQPSAGPHDPRTEPRRGPSIFNLPITKQRINPPLADLSATTSPSSPSLSPSIGPTSMSSVAGSRPINRPINRIDLGMRPIGSPTGTVSYGQSSSLSSLGFSSDINNGDRAGTRSRRGSASLSRRGSEAMDVAPTVYNPSSRRNSIFLDSSNPSDSDGDEMDDDEEYSELRRRSQGQLKMFGLPQRPARSRNNSSNTSLRGNSLPSLIQPAPIRLISSNGRSLKPKGKNFLRISKELEAEAAPLGYEMLREAEISAALRQDYLSKSSFTRTVSPITAVFSFDEDTTSSSNPASKLNLLGDTSSMSRSASPGSSNSSSKRLTPTTLSSIPKQSAAPQLTVQTVSAILRTPPLAPFKGPLFSDTEDSDVLSTSPSASFTSNKRKILMDETDSSVFKRRAVSPGGMTPVIGSPTVKRTTMKQMQDASEGVQSMRLN